MKHKVLTILIILLAPKLLAVQYNGDDMVDFTAYIAKDKVNIQWRANERDKIKSYNLERSREGKEFESFKEILDEGVSPRIAEFIESDFSPMQGGSFDRNHYETNKGKNICNPCSACFLQSRPIAKRLTHCP